MTMPTTDSAASQAADPACDRPPLHILLAAPRGFCAGVDRAVQIVEQALARYGAPVYVRHEIVHNRYVVEGLEKRGAIFVDELDQVPDGAPVIFSAHGVPKSVPAEAARRKLLYLDATCPLVSKVHREAERHFAAGHQILLIGHADHPEVVGTMGQLPPGAVVLVETVEAAEVIEIEGPKKDDICYATANRQKAVKAIAQRCDALLVLGAPNSSNSMRLVEVALAAGCPDAFLVRRAAEIDWRRLAGVSQLGITAGASAPEVLVEEVIAAAKARFAVTLEEIAVTRETVEFKLPKALSAQA